MKKIKLSDGREIAMQEPTVKMMKKAAKRDGEFDQTVALVSETTGLPEDEIDEMPLSDFIPLKGAIEDFLLKTGVPAPLTK